MIKTFKNHCLKPTQSKLHELGDIGKRYASVKNHVFQKYGSLSGLQYLSYPRKIRDEWVETGYGNRFGLQARYWKQAFEEAFSNIRSNWSNAIAEVKENLVRNSSFTDVEKHYAFYLLKATDLLHKALSFEEFDLPNKFQGTVLQRERVHKYLKSCLRKHLGRKPSQHKKRSFQIDANMYDCWKDDRGRLWIAVMGPTPRKRVKLLLTSSVVPEGNVRIVLAGKRIEIHHTEDVESVPLNGEDARAVDKGYTEVITSSSGTKYGEGFGGLLKTESDRLSEKNAKRNKLRALAEKYEGKGDIVKAETIRKFNLGKKKYRHQKVDNLNDIKRHVNLALNSFFQTEKPSVLGVENLNFTSWNKKLPKKVNRYFSSWLKGYLRERIEVKAMLNGVQQVVVNSAYGSQVCHLCGGFGIRKGDRFYCATHGEMDADHNAALLYLARMDDPEITVYTPYQKVKDILQARLRLSNQDSRHSAVTAAGQSESELTRAYV